MSTVHTWDHDDHEDEESIDWNVPDNVYRVTIRCWGAEGSADEEDKQSGGAGGYVEGEMDVEPGDTLYIRAGEGGGTSRSENWPGGGAGGGNFDDAHGGAGGGYSGVRYEDDETDATVIVAGGGGGAGGASDATGTHPVEGGDGGNPGQDGDDGFEDGGEGATQDGGGDGATSSTASSYLHGRDGEAWEGGQGGAGQSPSNSAERTAGGGGGGRYGGGGGATDLDTLAPGAGGGGSSWVDSNHISNESYTTGENDNGNGWVEIEYENPPEKIEGVEVTHVALNEVDLEWDEDDYADEYNIYRDGSHVDTTSETEYTDDGLDSDTEYEWAISGENDAAEGPESDKVTATTGGTPSDLSASGGDREVALTWSINANDGDVHGVELYRAESTGVGTGDDLVADLGDTESHTDNGADVDGRTYYYAVRVEYRDGFSDLADEDSATTDLPDPAIDAVNATDLREVTVELTIPDNNSDGGIGIRRRPTADTGDDVLVAERDDPDDSDHVDDEDLLDGEEYEYRVERDTGDAEADSDWEVVLTEFPDPEDLDVTDVDGRHLTIEFVDPSNNTTGYRVWIRKAGDDEYDQDGDDLDPVGEGEMKTYETTELLDGQAYALTVEAFTDYTEGYYQGAE